MKYQWILFDADETLFHFDAYQGLKLMFSRFNVDFSIQDFEHYQLVNQPLWVEYQDGKISAAELQNTRFAMWAEKLGVAATRLNAEFLTAMADICSLLPGAQELLDALSGKVNMGIITNGFTALQTIRLERTGLKNVFSPLIISEQVGAAKPDVAIFEYAFNLMNNPAKENILMVGDNLHSDIQGGINAGIDTCWLNTHGAQADNNITPRYQVSSLAELQKLLLA
ncbi:noncanonical pyrimidine nucleotidase, YjjG family [Yersinia rohdei]|uniref:Nucleotidase n=1 Tax=Yersinia rohdei TaxID=29485 RepID=A0A0U1HPK0_YERRO|nr:pyrimidine 5'-nucleotidase [Yersinia rohdei]AJJ10831.1 noncanonical pyrimidine nucleotidase, YjjG family [Yersinia rohdei]EEQ04199.1 5'-nucleotidase yjjG [Yersinia rohdei ATCC 43380]CNE04620.1 nucleotidase [Yersinia rohdei]CNI31734.1 nucleotidase [Yersinia rohdei]CQI88479.1 nucleotidase [Yersinia rohdei]